MLLMNDFIDHYLSNYRLVNVTRNLQEALADQSISEDFGYCSASENFVLVLEGLKKGLRNSLINWKFREKAANNFVILSHSTKYYLVFSKKKMNLYFLKTKRNWKASLAVAFLKGSHRSEFFFFYLNLDFATFEQQCQLPNIFLMGKNLFPRVYELKKKFRYRIKKHSSVRLVYLCRREIQRFWSR